MLDGNKKLTAAILVSIFLCVGAFFMVNVEIPPALHHVSALNMILFTLPTFWATYRWLGTRDAVIMISALGLFALLIETIGLKTGFPYGHFAYSDLLGYKLLGLTPWTVFFAWTPLVLATIALTHRSVGSAIIRIPLIAILLVVFDMVLDPGAVYLRFWKFEAGGLYYNVPWTNFAGWFFSGLIGATIAEILLAKFKPLLPAPAQLMLSAFFTLVFWTSVSLWAGLWISGILGVIVLAALTVGYNKYYYAFDDMIVFVDNANQPLSTGPKLASHHSDTELHRAFSVFLFNDRGELLLQQRALSKKTWPGIWSNSCCGHQMLHERPEAAAARRLKYELGIRGIELEMMLSGYRYRAEKDGVVENEICPVMVGKLDIEARPNPAEVENIKWIQWDDFLEEISRSGHSYSPWAAEEAMLLNTDKKFQEWFKKNV